jgi:hypothetical protein
MRFDAVEVQILLLAAVERTEPPTDFVVFLAPWSQSTVIFAFTDSPSFNLVVSTDEELTNRN